MNGVVRNVAVLESSFSQGSRTGLLVGHSNGYIINCYSSGTVTAGASQYNAGGLVGTNNGIIRNSYSVADVVGQYNSGGLCGSGGAAGDSVINSWSGGSVSGIGTNVGGLIGGYGGAVFANCGWNNHSGNPTYAIGSSSSNVTHTISDDIAWFYDASRGLYTAAPAWDFSSGDIWYENITALPSFWGETQ